MLNTFKDIYMKDDQAAKSSIRGLIFDIFYLKMYFRIKTFYYLAVWNSSLKNVLYLIINKAL